jgi:hypothetical protein
MKLELEPGAIELVANATEAADFLKKFAHPSRLMIVCALVEGNARCAILRTRCRPASNKAP